MPVVSIFLLYWLIVMLAASFLVRREHWQSEYGQEFDAPVITTVHRIVLVAAPLWLPICAVGMLLICIGIVVSDFIERRKLVCFRRHHHDPEHSPLNFLYLDKSIQDWYDQLTPEFFQLGFSLVGDFQYRTEPLNIIDRFFLSDDGTIVAALSAVNHKPHSFGMEAITARGDVINITNMDPASIPNRPDERDPYRLAFVPESFRPGEMLSKFHELVGATSLHSFRADQIGDFQQFCSRRYSEWKHRIGKRSMPPEPILPGSIECDELHARSIAG